MQMRKSKKFISLLPMIRNLIEQGYTHKVIIKELNDNHGLEISLSTFHKYLYRYKDFNKISDFDKTNTLKETNATKLDINFLDGLTGSKQPKIEEKELSLAQKQGMAGDMNEVRRKARELLNQANQQKYRLD